MARLRPGTSADEATELDELEAVARRARSAPAGFPDATALADALGTSRARLGELFREHFHDTPDGFLERARVRAAAGRLADAGGGAQDAGPAVGFGSAGAFREAFERRMALPPEEYRETVRAPRAGRPFRLRLPADFRAEDTLARIGRDAESLTECRTRNGFAVALELGGRPAVLRVELGRGSARCEIEARGRVSRAGRAAAHGVALRLLGLGTDPAPFERRVRRMRGMGRLVRGRAGTRVPLTVDAFDALVWSVVGQQVNLAFAMTCRRRLIRLAGTPGTSTPGGLVPHPSPAAVARLDPADLAPLQFSRRKAEYVVDTARLIASGALDLDGLADVSATRAERALVGVRGIGPWSANYVMMRGLGLADCLPVGDAGLVLSLQRFFSLDRRPDAEETRERMKPFRPFRSLACLHFWQRLGDDA